jgi:excisionase family DNA binding protein
MSSSITRFLTVSEAAALLGLSYAACWRLVQKGEIPAKRFGTNIRIPAPELRKYIRNANVSA